METAGHGGEDGSSFAVLREAARHIYGADAAGYRDGRPDYPPRLYEVLRSRCGLAAGSRVLEIGPGSGLVTEHLVAAGAGVVAVEPDRGFAEYLGRTVPEVRVVEVPFEEAEIGTGFDVVVAATSFHWLDPSTALPNWAVCCGRAGGRRSGGRCSPTRTEKILCWPRPPLPWGSNRAINAVGRRSNSTPPLDAKICVAVLVWSTSPRS